MLNQKKEPMNLIINPTDYQELAQIGNWRKILLNFYEADFKYQNKTYHTAEHTLQTPKISLVDA